MLVTTPVNKQFLTDTAWGELDVLVVDTPPGTSDEHITVMENFKNLSKDVLDGAVLVTTPQALAVGDVRRELTFCKKAGFIFVRTAIYQGEVLTQLSQKSSLSNSKF